MANASDLDGPVRAPLSGKPPRALVVLLHGLGADGNDLIGLAPYWAPHLPHVEFVSPNAPFPCDMAPYGRQWFSLQDRSPDAVLAGVRMAWGILDGFLDAELARTGLAADRLALVGFSQGTMMSLFTGPRRAERIAGIVGYSGRLVGAEALAAELKSRPPVTLVHGDADEILPVSSLPEAVKGLEAAGIEVASTVRPRRGHSIDETGLRIGLEFLLRVLRA